jgi:hypothetical protein
MKAQRACLPAPPCRPCQSRGFVVHWQLTTDQQEHEQMTNEPMPASSRAKGANNPTEDKTRLISLAEAAEMYGLSTSYLRQIAIKGRLIAQKIGGMWVTTPADVKAYIRSREKRGAYRDDITA